MKGLPSAWWRIKLKGWIHISSRKFSTNCSREISDKTGKRPRTKSFYLIPVRGNKPHGVYESVTLKLVSRLQRATKVDDDVLGGEKYPEAKLLGGTNITNALGKLLKVKKRG